MDNITFDNGPSGYPMQPNRIKFETELVQDPASPKLVQELPANEFSQQAMVSYAKFNKLAVVRHGDNYYLFDRRQISEPEVRKKLASGTIGGILGYSEDTEPEEGTQVALSIDRKFSADPEEIVGWRDDDTLGLTWKASDIGTAEELANRYGGEHGD